MEHNCKIVGILNITPDSFSDGGSYNNKDAAIKQAEKLIKDGADVIDIGAQSTRPNAQILSHNQEWQRLENILPQICQTTKNAGILSSIDTFHAQTAQKAIACGIDWVNDVSGATNPQMVELLAEFKGAVVIMHNLGVPADRNVIINPDLNVCNEVINWLQMRLEILEKSGIAKDRVIIDPGVGFGKNAAQSWQIVNNIAIFKKIGAKILVGHSRKSFLNYEGTVADIDSATVTVSKKLAQQGVDYLRVHNVAIHK